MFHSTCLSIITTMNNCTIQFVLHTLKTPSSCTVMFMPLISELMFLLLCGPLLIPLVDAKAHIHTRIRKRNYKPIFRSDRRAIKLAIEK